METPGAGSTNGGQFGSGEQPDFVLDDIDAAIAAHNAAQPPAAEVPADHPLKEFTDYIKQEGAGGYDQLPSIGYDDAQDSDTPDRSKQ